MSKELADGLVMFFFFVLVVVFALWERSRPRTRFDWKKDIVLDVIGFTMGLPLLIEASAGLILGDSLAGFAAVKEQVLVLPFPVRFVLGIVAADFCLYWWHRALHTPLLWRMHVFHHSTENLYWFSGIRASYLHDLTLALSIVLPTYLFYDAPWELMLWGFFRLLVQFWAHANISLNTGWIEHVLVTPDYHRFHHAKANVEGKNLGIIFAFWDKLFGTQEANFDRSQPHPTGVDERVNVVRAAIGL